MDNTTRENLIRAAMCLAKAMESYAATGADDYKEVGHTMMECMKTVSDKLDEKDQMAFANWLVKKTKEKREELMIVRALNEALD